MWKKSLISIAMIFLAAALLIQPISAASSSNYSVEMFGTAMAVSDSSSSNYETTSLTEAKGTTRNAGSDVYTSNIGFFDNTNYSRTVSINSYAIFPKTAEVGSTIKLYISAVNHESLWARIVSPNEQEQIITLMNNKNVSFVPSPSVVGIYNITFYANSTTGAVSSIVDSFELTEREEEEETPPSSGGGGGGKTTIIEKCNYNWECTPWSICSNGKQTRECKNIGTCIGDESKPIEEMKCSNALFDITLNVKDVEFSNNSLNFIINLTETIGVEKLDVYIKYSIIDQEGYEIFSEIETRAIQEKSIFEKNLDDMVLPPGQYIFRVDILYGNLQRAFAEHRFQIKGAPVTGHTLFDTLSSPNYLFIIIMMIIVVLYILHKKKFRPFLIKEISFIRKLFGLFLFTYGVIIEKIAIRKKYPSNSIRGLINKKVYTKDGDYIGKVKEVLLGENKVDSLKIKTTKAVQKKGIIVKYKNIEVGHIVIIKGDVLKHLSDAESS